MGKRLLRSSGEGQGEVQGEGGRWGRRLLNKTGADVYVCILLVVDTGVCACRAR